MATPAPRPGQQESDDEGREPAPAPGGDPETGSTAEDPAVERTGPPPGGSDPMGGEAPSG